MRDQFEFEFPSSGCIASFPSRDPMTSLHQAPPGQDAETLYWLDLAKRVLSGEIDPDEVLDLLNSDSPSADARGSED
jgi:hypothetical protein